MDDADDAKEEVGDSLTKALHHAATRSGELVVRPDLRFNGIKVFSATIADHRANLGEVITAWLAAHPDIVIVDVTVRQSSDAFFHCVAIVIAYWQAVAPR